jgi:hypothetical protein
VWHCRGCETAARVWSGGWRQGNEARLLRPTRGAGAWHDDLGGGAQRQREAGGVRREMKMSGLPSKEWVWCMTARVCEGAVMPKLRRVREE